MLGLAANLSCSLSNNLENYYWTTCSGKLVLLDDNIYIFSSYANITFICKSLYFLDCDTIKIPRGKQGRTVNSRNACAAVAWPSAGLHWWVSDSCCRAVQPLLQNSRLAVFSKRSYSWSGQHYLRKLSEGYCFFWCEIRCLLLWGVWGLLVGGGWSLGKGRGWSLSERGVKPR